MPEIKPYLKNLYRFDSEVRTRIGYLRLDMNENVNGLPKKFIKRVFSKIKPELLSTYPEYITVKNKIAAHNHIRPENICLANGSDAAIKYIFDAYIKLGDKVLITDPTFAMYPVYCKIFNAKSIVISYKGNLMFPEKEFLKAISAAIKLAIIVNPNNPTGSVVGQDYLIKTIKQAAAKNVLVVVDEAYYYFYPKTVIREVNKYKNLIVLRTFSKLCALASARLGYAAACPEIIKNLRKVKPTYDVSGIGCVFVEQLLANPRIISGLVKEINVGKKFLVKKLCAQDIEHKNGEANFILIKCKGRVNEISHKLIKNKILIGSGFRQEILKDYIRVSVGKREIMERFWKSFIEIWRG